MKLNENNYCKKCDDKWPMRAGKRGPAALEWEVVPCWDTRGRMHCAQGGWGGGQERCCRSFDARPRGGQASFARTWGHAGEAASLVEA